MTTETNGDDIKTEKNLGPAISQPDLIGSETSKKLNPDGNGSDEPNDDLEVPPARVLRPRKMVIRILDEVNDDILMPEPNEMARRRRRGGSRRRSRSRTRSRSRRRRSRRRR